MRRLSCALSAAVLCALPFVSVRAEAAPYYPYCSEFPDRGDVTCAFTSFAQCMATAGGGAGGHCVENPFSGPPVTTRAPRKVKRNPG